MEAFVAALLLGVVTGLRTFTALAVLWFVRHPGPFAFVLGGAAIFEYGFDLYPKAPPRTSAGGLTGRVFAGAFCGWAVTAVAGSPPIAGALLGACGALIGAYGGLATRRRVTTLIGPVPAALLEDAIAIAGALAIVLKLT